MNGYETGLWHSFQARFGNARIVAADTVGAEYHVSLSQPAYRLVFETSDDSICFVYRSFDHSGPAQTLAWRWLGRLFYCLDAGDSAAAADWLFDSRIRVRQGQVHDKQTLLNAFLQQTAPLTLYSLDIQPSDDHVALDVSLSPLQSFTVLVPVDRLDPVPVYIHQQRFADRLRLALQRAMPDSVRLPVDLPAPRSLSDTLCIAYHSHRYPGFEQLCFRATRRSDSLLIWQPVLQVKAEPINNRVLIDDRYSVPVLGKMNRSVQCRIKTLLETLYSQWLLKTNKSPVRVCLRVRAYDVHEFTWQTPAHWEAAIQQFNRLGRSIFIPGEIDVRQGTRISGVLTLEPEVSAYHHMGDWSLISRQGQADSLHLEFYPYIKSNSDYR